MKRRAHYGQEGGGDRREGALPRICRARAGHVDREVPSGDRWKGDDLIYTGKVDHGFDKKSSAELRKS